MIAVGVLLGDLVLVEGMTLHFGHPYTNPVTFPTHPQTELLGTGAPGSLPWALIPGVDPASDDMTFTTDPFAPVLAETSLPAASVADFIDRAVDFCNNRLWGTLAATVIAHRRTLRDREATEAFERGIATLRYGTIVANGPATFPAAFCSPPWGAFPGHPANDIQSGFGFVHNTYLFASSEKTVFRVPFRTVPKPPWFVTHSRTREVYARLSALEAAPSPAKLPRIFLETLRG